MLQMKEVMQLDIDTIQKNQTQILVNKPITKKLIGLKWIYKVKLNPDGSINKYKTRLMAKGFAQQYGLDYIETFAPMTRLDTIKLLLALTAQHGWTVHQLNVKSTFLNGKLIEEVYVDNLKAFRGKTWNRKCSY